MAERQSLGGQKTMEKLFIVEVNSFETKMIVNMLKRNNKQCIIAKGESFSDQLSKEIEKAIKKQKQIIFVGFEPAKGEWVEYFGEDAPEYKTITYKYEYYRGREKSILKRVAEIVANDVLNDLEKIVAEGIEAHEYIPRMESMAGHLGHQKSTKIVKNVLKGTALYDGISKEAWKDAELAIQNKKEMGDLIVVEYSHEDYDPIVDLAYGQYHHLLILNRKEDKGVLYTHNSDLVEVVQASGGETWTYRRDGYSRYRVTFSDHLDRVEEAVKRYFATC